MQANPQALGQGGRFRAETSYNPISMSIAGNLICLPSGCSFAGSSSLGTPYSNDCISERSGRREGWRGWERAYLEDNPHQRCGAALSRLVAGGSVSVSHRELVESSRWRPPRPPRHLLPTTNMRVLFAALCRFASVFTVVVLVVIAAAGTSSASDSVPRAEFIKTAHDASPAGTGGPSGGPSGGPKPLRVLALMTMDTMSHHLWLASLTLRLAERGHGVHSVDVATPK